MLNDYGKKFNVLVIEGNSAICEYISLLLSTPPFKARVVATVNDAVELMRCKNDYRIVLMDWNTTGLSREAFNRVLFENPHIAIVPMSANPQDKYEAAQLGLKSFVSKPFNLETLLNQFNSAVPSATVAIDRQFNRESSTFIQEIGKKNNMQQQAAS